MNVWLGVGVSSCLVAVVAVARGGGATWDFQGDPLNASPAGFTFGRTGQGREGKRVVLR